MNKTLLLTALVSASALAQEAPPPSPPPEPPPAAPAPPPDAPVAMPMDTDPGGRVRWGVSGNLGWHLPQSAFTFGGEGRIGYQITNMLGAYAIVGGNPARFIRWRYPEPVIEALSGFDWWNWDAERMRRNRHLFEIDLTTADPAELVMLLRNAT